MMARSTIAFLSLCIIGFAHAITRKRLGACSENCVRNLLDRMTHHKIQPLYVLQAGAVDTELAYDLHEDSCSQVQNAVDCFSACPRGSAVGQRIRERRPKEPNCRTDDSSFWRRSVLACLVTNRASIVTLCGIDGIAELYDNSLQLSAETESLLTATGRNATELTKSIGERVLAVCSLTYVTSQCISEAVSELGCPAGVAEAIIRHSNAPLCEGKALDLAGSELQIIDILQLLESHFVSWGTTSAASATLFLFNLTLSLIIPCLALVL